MSSLSASESVAVERERFHVHDAWLQWLMVLLVLSATVFMAIKNNQADIVFQMCTLCFGYYFGARNTPPPPATT